MLLQSKAENFSSMRSKALSQPRQERSGRWWLKVLNLITLLLFLWNAAVVCFTLTMRSSLEELFGGPGAMTPVDLSPVLGFFMNGFWAGVVVFVGLLMVVKEFLLLSLPIKLAVNLAGVLLLSLILGALIELIFI